MCFDDIHTPWVMSLMTVKVGSRDSIPLGDGTKVRRASSAPKGPKATVLQYYPPHIMKSDPDNLIL